MLLKWLDVLVFYICTNIQKEQFVNIFKLGLWLQMLFETLFILVDSNFEELYKRQN